MSASVASLRRRRAARKYKPSCVALLLVAEAPPRAPDRYFYFDDVQTQDSLFRYVCKVILGRVPNRDDKPVALSELKDRGVFLIDLSEEPIGATPLTSFVQDLVERCRALKPTEIILIKATVYDAAYQELSEAGLPVVDERIPFPGSGQQRRFEEAFGRAVGTRG